jgi:hypothetical protein
LPDLFRVLGILPGRNELEVRAPAGRDAHRDRQQGREPPPQRGADGPRDVR